MDAIFFPKGARQPSLTDTITENEREKDLTGATVKFRMRLEHLTTLSIDADAVVEDQSSKRGKVRYDWDTGDTDAQGIYRFWWFITYQDGTTQETPENRFVIYEHAPGEGVRTGAIAVDARYHLPTTYDVLAKKNGDAYMQGVIEVVKYRVLDDIVLAADESSLNPLVINYLGKLVALELIPAGLDYWLDQHQQISAQGTDESVSYPDRVNALKKLEESLIAQVRRDEPLVLPLITNGRAQSTLSGPAIDVNTDQKVTEDPGEFPPISTFPFPRDSIW